MSQRSLYLGLKLDAKNKLQLSDFSDPELFSS